MKIAALVAVPVIGLLAVGLAWKAGTASAPEAPSRDSRADEPPPPGRTDNDDKSALVSRPPANRVEPASPSSLPPVDEGEEPEAATDPPPGEPDPAPPAALRPGSPVPSPASPPAPAPTVLTAEEIARVDPLDVPGLFRGNPPARQPLPGGKVEIWVPVRSEQVASRLLVEPDLPAGVPYRCNRGAIVDKEPARSREGQLRFPYALVEVYRRDLPRIGNALPASEVDVEAKATVLMDRYCQPYTRPAGQRRIATFFGNLDLSTDARRQRASRLLRHAELLHLPKAVAERLHRKHKLP